VSVTVRRLLLLAAAIASAALAIDTALRYSAPIYAAFGASLYAVAATLLAAAAAVLARDPVRGRLFAIAGAIILASWVAAIGYGGVEIPARLIAVVAMVAAVAPLIGAPPRWAGLALGALVVATVPLLYFISVHPPLALVGIDAVAGIGISAAVLGLLPAATRRWPLAAIAAIGVAGWLLGTFALLLAFGLPLASS
jgi:hypothetical protein